MSESLISSFLVSAVSESLRSLTKNELWEQIAQVARQKWAIVSKSLRKLTKKEQMSKSLIFMRELLIRSFLGKKQAIRSENGWANSQPWKTGSNLQIQHWELVCNSLFVFAIICLWLLLLPTML